MYVCSHRVELHHGAAQEGIESSRGRGAVVCQNVHGPALHGPRLPGGAFT